VYPLQRNGVCIFADYGLFANGTVSVHNQMRLYTADGNETSIQGFAQPDGSGLPGRLTVQLGGTPFPAPYWIVDIGPVINDKYEWMIVTDNLQLTMWVLVRDVEEYMKRSDNSRHAAADTPAPAAGLWRPPLHSP
jgi:lipocalin